MRLLHVCAYYTCMRLLCVYVKPVYDVYRDQRSLNTTGQRFPQQESSTDLHAVLPVTWAS